jgi:hypothetical protein
VPLFISVPKGAPGLPDKSAPAICNKLVSTFDIFRTLLNLTKVPDRESPPVAGNNLIKLLDDSQSDWPHHTVTQLGRPGDYAVSGERFRYIHYQNGDEELYDIANDPHEHDNLATKPEHASTLAAMRTLGPKDPKPLVMPKQAMLGLENAVDLALTREGEPPVSKPNGKSTAILLRNLTGFSIKLFWIDQQGQRHPYGEIETAADRTIRTHAGLTWLIEYADGKPIGHFTTPATGAKVLIE